MIITLVLSSICYGVIISAGTIHAYHGWAIRALMCSPGIAAIVTQLAYTRSLRGLGWKVGKAKYLLLAHMIPLVYCTAVNAITWLSGLGVFPNADLANHLKESEASLGVFIIKAAC